MLVTDSAMRSRGQYAYIRLALRMRVPLAIVAMSCALVGLALNYFQVDPFLRPLGDRSATHPITAFCMFGVGLCIATMQRFKPSPLWRKAIAGA